MAMPNTFQKQAQDRFIMNIPGQVRDLLNANINQTSCFIDERPGVGGGSIEFRVLTKAHGECIGAIRVERR